MGLVLALDFYISVSLLGYDEGSKEVLTQLICFASLLVILGLIFFLHFV